MYSGKKHCAILTKNGVKILQIEQEKSAEKFEVFGCFRHNNAVGG